MLMDLPQPFPQALMGASPGLEEVPYQERLEAALVAFLGAGHLAGSVSQGLEHSAFAPCGAERCKFYVIKWSTYMSQNGTDSVEFRHWKRT